MYIFFIFRDKVDNTTAPHKVTISEVIYPTDKCLANFGLITWVCLLVAGIFWILRFIKVLYHILHFWEIKSFFNDTLKIEDVSKTGIIEGII